MFDENADFIGIVPKKQPGEFRLITHLSFPPGRSINNGIDKEACSVRYASFDQAVTLVQKLGVGAEMAKADVKSAFRLLPIYPGDFDLLGFQFQGYYFIDKCVPMGAAVSCSLFETFSTFLEFRLKQVTGSNAATHFIDDFLVAGAASTGQCSTQLKAFQNMCEELGVPLAPEKTVGPTTCLSYLGLEIDSVGQKVKVPQDKVAKLHRDLQKAISSHSMSLVAIQSLIGSLNFVCKAISPGRAFIRRLIDLTQGVTNPKAQIRIGNGAKRDIEMWIAFLHDFNGTAMFLDDHWVSNASCDLYTDAAGSLGFGAYYQGHWTQGLWPPRLQAQSLSIAFMELFPIVVALEIWGTSMANKKIKMWSDNQAVVAIINKQSSKCSLIMPYVRKLVLCALKHNIMFQALYVPGSSNCISDSLSRFQNHKFKQLAPHADVVMTALPPWAT